MHSQTTQPQKVWKKPDNRSTPSDKGEGMSKQKSQKKDLKIKYVEVEEDTSEGENSSQDERELIAATLVGTPSSEDEPHDAPSPRNLGFKGGQSKTDFRMRSL